MFNVASCIKGTQGCARFPQFVQNVSERQILWSLCSVDFHTLTLQLPIQTPHSVAPELQVFVSSLQNCQNFRKTSTPLESWFDVVYDHCKQIIYQTVRKVTLHGNSFQ